MENLRAIRKARKMTQEDLALLVGVSASSISQYESGSKTPSFETALKLAEALDCESADLVTSRTGLTEAIEKGNKKAATSGDGVVAINKLMELIPNLTPQQAEFLLPQVLGLISAQQDQGVSK